MNTSIMIPRRERPRMKLRSPGDYWSNLSLALLLTGLVVGSTACKTTREVSAKHIEESGFLSDYSQLHPGTNGEAALVYWNPSADWKKYTKVKLDPVQLWDSSDPDSPIGKLSQEDQQMLVGTFYDAMYSQLSTNYQMVDQPGPDVLVIRTALTQAGKSHPVANLITSVYLPLKVVSFGKRLVTGTDIAVGSVTAEGEILDGQTNERLAATVDRRAGTKALRTKFNNTWGDVELAFEAWAKQLDERLAQRRAGIPEGTALGGSENP